MAQLVLLTAHQFTVGILGKELDILVKFLFKLVDNWFIAIPPVNPRPVDFEPILDDCTAQHDD